MLFSSSRGSDAEEISPSLVWIELKRCTRDSSGTIEILNYSKKCFHFALVMAKMLL